MIVQELISKLEAIEDKELEVCFYDFVFDEDIPLTLVEEKPSENDKQIIAIC